MIRTTLLATLVFLSAWAAAAGDPPATAGPRPAVVEGDAEIVNWNTGVNYTYDGSGNITVVGNDTFRYDTAGRLVQTTVNGTTRIYDYDPFGNRTACKEGASQVDCQGQAVASAINRLTGQAHQYSASGSLELRTGRSYAYDALDMQTSQQVTGTTPREYIYTADDERIAVYTTSGWWQWTVRDTSGRVLRELTSQDQGGAFGVANWQWTKDYVYRGNEFLASRQIAPGASTPSTYHYHLDHLGTPRRITNDTDVIVGHHDYYAFGPETPGSTNEASLTRLKYTAHERDVIDGTTEALDYMHARYYDPTVGRFLSVDPGRDWDPRTPQSWNRYGYARGNPMKYLDPDGLAVKNYKFLKTGANQVPTHGPKTLGLQADPLGFNLWFNVGIEFDAGDDLNNYRVERDAQILSPTREFRSDSRENPDPHQVSQKGSEMFVVDGPGLRGGRRGDGSMTDRTSFGHGSFVAIFEIRVVDKSQKKYDDKRLYYGVRIDYKNGKPGEPTLEAMSEQQYRKLVQEKKRTEPRPK